MGVGAGLYKYDVVIKSSRSLSHLLMSSCLLYWRHLANMTEPSMCGGDAALCQITLTTCYFAYQ